MPVRAIPYYCNPAKIQSKTLSFTQTRPPGTHRMPLHATPKIKDDKSEGKVMEIAAIICQRQRPQPTHKHTHTHAQLAGRCSLGLLCASKIVTKITERQAKKKQKEEQQKKNNIYFYHDNVAVPPPACHAPS